MKTQTAFRGRVFKIKQILVKKSKSIYHKLKADRGNDGKTTSKSRLASNGIYYYEKTRIARSGGSWL